MTGPSAAAQGTRMRVWVAAEIEKRCPQVGRWAANAGFAIAASARGAEVAITAPARKPGQARYTIAVSVDASGDDVRALLGAGFDDVLPAPVGEAQVVAALILAEARLGGSAPGSASELRQLLDAIPDMVSLSTLDTTISWANAAHREMLGYTTQELAGQSGLDLVHPEDAERATAALATLRGAGPGSEVDLRLRRKDGSWAHVELSARILPGVPPRILAVSRPLGDRMDFVRALRESEERFRTVVDTSPDLVTIVDESGRITFANQAHATRLGLDPASLIGRNALTLIHPDQQTSSYQAFLDIINLGSEIRRTTSLGHADGRWLPFDVSARRFRGPSGATGLVIVSRDETEREAAIAQLARLSTTLAVQQEATLDGIFVVDENRRAISWNSRYLEIWNIPREVVIAGLAERSAHVLGQLSDPEEINQLVAAVYADPESTCSHEVRLVDGRFLEMHTAPLVAEDGARYGRAWYYRDITARRRAEEALQASEDRYRRLVELAPLAIAVHREGELVYINNTGARLFGLEAEEMLGTPMFSLLHPDDRDAVAAASAANTHAAGSPEGTRFIDARVILANGATRHVEMASGRTTYDGLPATQTVIRDITDRLQVEEALRQSEKRYREVVENSPDAIVVHDGETIRYANPAAARLFGAAAPGEMAGHPWDDFLARPSPEVLAERTRRTGMEHSFTVEEPRHLVKRNLTTELEMAFAPTRFDGRRAFQVVIRDVTERRRAEQERLALERALLETQKFESLGVMAGGIAHDFNNLLVAIMGNAGLAAMELPENSPARRYLREIETASQRAADLARQMLAYSGKGHFIVSWTDLGALVEETCNLLRASLPPRVLLNLRLAPGLPQIKCDATQIRQVVMNLVINAGESIGEREGVITVTTGEVEVLPGDPAIPAEALEPGRHVFLDVRDTGAGMDAATRSRIFEPFFTTKFTGRGLGLAAVLGIARGHSGAIRVESEPGAGTTFRLLLPVRGVAPPSAPAASPGVAPPAAGGRILVVDDEESVRRVAEGMLTRLGYQVVACRDGDDAVTAAGESAEGFAVILLDMLIPGSGGSDVLRRLRDAGLTCPVILMSGYSEEQALEGLPAGTSAAFLQKPFTMAELKGLIGPLLG